VLGGEGGLGDEVGLLGGGDGGWCHRASVTHGQYGVVRLWRGQRG
jgi:hypothetical protein